MCVCFADYFAGYPTGDETFEYDKVGNRLEVEQGESTQEYTVDNLTNQYTAIDAQSVSYDNAGNLTEDHRGYSYVYDYENRLIEVVDPNENLIAEFTYDALGRRIRKIDQVAGVTILYYYKDWQVLTEIADDGEDETNYDYIYGNYLDEVLLRTTDETTDVYLVHDHLYSPVALLDATGAVQERYEYDAYGKRYVYDASFNTRTSSSYDLTIGFTGQRLDLLDDGDLPLGYYKNRYYDTETGRFISYDPLGTNPYEMLSNSTFILDMQYNDGANLYQYALSDPLSYYDEYGLACKVYYHCRIVKQTKISKKRIDCEYICTETKRVDAIGGVTSCKDLPTPMVMTYGTSDRRWFRKACNCKTTVSHSQLYYEQGSPWGNCSRKACRDKCDQALKAALKLCKAIKDPISKRICIAAANLPHGTCIDGCNAGCKNP